MHPWMVLVGLSVSIPTSVAPARLTLMRGSFSCALLDRAHSSQLSWLSCSSTRSRLEPTRAPSICSSQAFFHTGLSLLANGAQYVLSIFHIYNRH